MLINIETTFGEIKNMNIKLNLEIHAIDKLKVEVMHYLKWYLLNNY